MRGGCVSFYCSITNYNKQQLKTILVILQFLWVRSPSMALLGPLYYRAYKAAINILSGTGSDLRLNWRRIYFHAYMVIGSIQFLIDCFTEGFSFMLDVIQIPPLVPCQMALFTGNLQHGSLLLQKRQGRMFLSKTGVTVSMQRNCIHVITHTCSPLLYSISKSKPPITPSPKGENYMGYGQQKRGSQE